MRRTSLQLKQEVMWPDAASLCYQIYSTFCHLFPEIQLKTLKPSAQSPLRCSEAWTTSSSPRKPSDQVSFPPQHKSGHIYAEYFINTFIHRVCRISSASCLQDFKSAINFKSCSWNKDSDASVEERKEEKKRKFIACVQGKAARLSMFWESDAFAYSCPVYWQIKIGMPFLLWCSSKINMFKYFFFA